MTGWTRVKVMPFARLLHDVPEALRWRLARSDKKNATTLQLISPRGVVWDFRMNGGVWIRKAGVAGTEKPKKGAPVVGAPE